jgi:acyl-CoA reductase-like NAD-dependent aldehyde dehydrogenase
MGKAERESYRKEVVSLAERLAAAGAEAAVWEVYARTERLIASLKFRLDYETPGVFTTLPDASDRAKLLRAARELLSEAAEQIAEGELVASIGTLRKARNELRSYLSEIRKSATRAESKAQVAPGKLDAATG